MSLVKSRPVARKRAECSADHIESVLLNGPITIAVDTEYQGPHTLTIQAATRLPSEQVAIQLYRSAELPPVPPWKGIQKHLPRLDRFVHRVKLLPEQLIGPTMSPTTFMHDLLGVSLQAMPLAEGRRLLDPDCKERPRNAIWDQTKKRFVVPHVLIRVVAHFLTADFTRMFGFPFYREVLGLDRGGAAALAIADGG